MGMLHLVRHGQASFGSDDYDRLSALGARQCDALGRWYAERGTRFAAVYTGTLVRHRQSLAALAAGFAEAGGGALPGAEELPALDEYDSASLVRAVHPGPLPPPDTPEAYRQHFRLLRDALAAWVAGRVAPAGMPDHAAWLAGIAAALDRVRAAHVGAEVLVVSSGGPIATATAHVMGAPPAAFVELNLRLRNSAVTEFAFNPKRHVLHSFNGLPHLLAPGREDWVSYA